VVSISQNDENNSMENKPSSSHKSNLFNLGTIINATKNNKSSKDIKRKRVINSNAKIREGILKR
jgi:hypothetical protein